MRVRESLTQMNRELWRMGDPGSLPALPNRGHSETDDQCGGHSPTFPYRCSSHRVGLHPEHVRLYGRAKC